MVGIVKEDFPRPISSHEAVAESDSPLPRTHIPVPHHLVRRQPWRSESGPREDRDFTSFEAYVPPEIASIEPSVPGLIISQSETALDEISRLDAEYGTRLAPLSGMMLRTEAIASSKIEDEHATVEDYLRAFYGNRSNRSALAMVHATDAIDHLLQNGIGTPSLLESHRMLMANAGIEAMYAGKYRNVQNWIAGSNHSPRGALHVPPPPQEVPRLMEDLLAFSNRRDIPVLVQASIMHAQFENIHPFTDGNGRIGRAMITALLRQCGHTRHTTIPIAAAFASRRQDYFRTLWAYRDGDAQPIVRLITESIRVASQESRVTAQRLVEMPYEWDTKAEKPRTHSTAGRIIKELSDTPFLSSDYLEETMNFSASAAHRALKQLSEAGIIREITGKKRNRVWVAADVIDELKSLELRIGERMTDFVI